MTTESRHLGPSGPARQPLSATLDAAAVLHVKGELDVATAPTLRAALDRVAETGVDVWLDLAGVTFMDSSGLLVLVTAAQEGDGSRLVLVRTSAEVQRVIELCGVGDLFEQR